MKYFTLEGASKGDIYKELVSKYGQNAIMFKITQEEIPDKSFGGVFKKKKVRFKAYCGLPEAEEDLAQLEHNRKKQQESERKSQGILAPEKQPKASVVHEERILHLSSEIEQLKNVVEHFVGQQVEEEAEEEEKNETVNEQFKAYLFQHDFSYKFIEEFMASLKVPVANLDTFKVILKEKLRLFVEEPKTLPDEARFFLFMGPTGVGKTTTLAKLAAIYFQEKKKKIRFVTFDTYRVGASKQLEIYAQVFRQPFHLINSAEDLKAVFLDIGPDEVVFMDTAGESQAKHIKMREIMGHLKEVKAEVKKFLVLAANSKASDIKKIKDKFRAFGYDYYIVSKMDETTTMGPILETLYKDPVALTYITMGQSVPEDIKNANLEELLSFFD